MKGLDIIGRSNTGTGKTAAFGIPVIEKILQNDSDFIQTLILCPTRELAQQACEEIKKFRAVPFGTALCLSINPVFGGFAGFRIYASLVQTRQREARRNCFEQAAFF